MEVTYKVAKSGCWECDSHAADSNGYPVAVIDGLWDRIYRHAFRAFNGVIGPNQVIRHTCDNRKCVNPEHLILGTHADNVADRVLRGRSARHENNGRAKLTKKDVIAIRQDTTTPKMYLAKKYGVDPKTIRSIKNGKTWV